MNTSVADIDQSVHRSARHPFLRVRTTFASRQPYAAHFHDCLSLGAVFEGATELRRPGGAERIAAGQMPLIAPMEPHSCNPLGGRPRGYHMFYIDAGWALEILGAPAGGAVAVRKSVLDDPVLYAALMRLAAAIREDREDPAARAALVRAVKENCAARPAAGENESSEVFSSWVERGESESVEKSARKLGMRRESYLRSFRRAAGVTPLRYRQCLRLIRAQELLRQGKSLVETALACGYADQSHFHRMCVKYLSATPSQMKPRPSLSSKK